jgi:acyl carrier protein
LDYARIATELRTPAQVMEHIRAGTRRAGPMANGDAPRTALERDLAALWTELLNIDATGIHDNFFELGGHSLLAMQLVSQVRAALGVTLPVRVIFMGPTVAEVAVHAEEALAGDIESMTPEELEAALQNLDGVDAKQDEVAIGSVA